MKYLDLFLKQYRISLSHQKGIEVSGIILFLKLMTLCIFRCFKNILALQGAAVCIEI